MAEHEGTEQGAPNVVASNIENEASSYGPQDIKMHVFTPDIDPDERGLRKRNRETS